MSSTRHGLNIGWKDNSDLCPPCPPCPCPPCPYSCHSVICHGSPGALGWAGRGTPRGHTTLILNNLCIQHSPPPPEYNNLHIKISLLCVGNLYLAESREVTKKYLWRNEIDQRLIHNCIVRISKPANLKCHESHENTTKCSILGAWHWLCIDRKWVNREANNRVIFTV